jgi:hypothetical protein
MNYRNLIRSLGLFFLLLMVIVPSSLAQDVWLWPVQGKKAGEDILYRPQDYIDKELNFDNLFIAVDKDANVVCPADGKISSIGLNYQISLTSAYYFKNDEKSSYADQIADAQQKWDKRRGGPRFLSASITIDIKDKKLNILGIIPNRLYKTGEFIRRGEVLGKASYSYKAIQRPCLMLSCSKNSRASDPMTPFGLVTTFKAPKPLVKKTFLTRAEAVADYKQLASSIREIYPSLEELMSYKDYDAFVAKEIASIPARISIHDFARMLQRYNVCIHDSHFYINLNAYLEKPKVKGQSVLISPLFFNAIGGKVIVTHASPEYRQFIGKEIAKVDNIPSQRLMNDETYCYCNYDAHIPSVKELDQASYLCLRYCYYTRGPQPKGAKIRLDFVDGTTVTAPLIENKNINKIFGDDFVNAWQYRRLNHAADGALYSCREIDGQTAYLGISSFELSEVETDEIMSFIKQMSDKKKPNLIIDVRNNFGGDSNVMARLLSCLIDKPTVITENYTKINKKSFLSPTENLVPNDTLMYAEYHPVKGKKGLYTDPSTSGILPDSVISYRGAIYMLTNASSYSAATDFPGCLVHNGRAISVGQETGSAYHFITAVHFANIYLKNTNINASIPIVKTITDGTVTPRFPQGRGLTPDVNMPITREQMCYKGDYVLDKTLALIKSKMAK